MLDILLALLGILLGMWMFSVIVLPIIYGIPKSTYYASKVVLKKSAIVFYLKVFLLWNILFIVVSFILVWYFPSTKNMLLENQGFAIGQLIGFFVGAQGLFTASGRKALNEDFWSLMSQRKLFDTDNKRFNEPLAREKMMSVLVKDS